MSHNVFDLVTVKEGYFEVDPGVMFPAMIVRVQDVLNGEEPLELVSKDWTGKPHRDPVVDKFLLQAESFDEKAWKLAKKPYKDVKDPDELALRVEVLAFLESWFKRALALAEGRGIRIHIIKNLDWKR